jgi:hypothetical protein
MLVSRVAGLGELRHRPIGFTGPLSQHLLGYNSIINVVRQTIRDLVEVASTHMFLTGCCNRSAVDLSQVAMKYVYRLNHLHFTNKSQASFPSSQQLRPQHCCQVLSRRVAKQRHRPYFSTNEGPSPGHGIDALLPAIC